MHLSRSLLDGLVIAALALTIAGLLAWFLLAGRLRRLQAEVAALRADPAILAGVDPKAVRHVAVVRYDAFEDMAGHLSYSVAMLDTAGDGLILSAINGRSDTRAYAKGVLAGAGEQTLSPEEQGAVDAALGRVPSRTSIRLPGGAPSRVRR
ncbi:MAG: DUF4446 family protein [Actinomycetota bacterium]|nr:DUF4446 family protein [Actinomycetota bacterium]